MGYLCYRTKSRTKLSRGLRTFYSSNKYGHRALKSEYGLSKMSGLFADQRKCQIQTSDISELVWRAGFPGG